MGKSHCVNGHPYPESKRIGRDSCAVCARDYAAIRRAANPERVKAINAASNQRHSKRVRERKTAWNQANPEKARIRTKAWRQANLDRRNAADREWRAANREQYNADRRARKAGRVGGRLLTPEERQETVDWVQIISKDPCAYCGENFEHVDHIDAISKDGDGLWTNLAAACVHCNTSKQAKPLLMFLYARSLASPIVLE